jgi:hypothetical protein
MNYFLFIMVIKEMMLMEANGQSEAALEASPSYHHLFRAVLCILCFSTESGPGVERRRSTRATRGRNDLFMSLTGGPEEDNRGSAHADEQATTFVPQI